MHTHTYRHIFHILKGFLYLICDLSYVYGHFNFQLAGQTDGGRYGATEEKYKAKEIGKQRRIRNVSCLNVRHSNREKHQVTHMLRT